MRRGSTLNSIEKNEIPVMISVRGEQYFDGVDPDATELMTEGTLETTDTGLLLRYRESELTGMEGTETTFEIGPRRVILRRSGSVSSQMVFEEGQQHTSLYETPYGELTVDIQTSRLLHNLTGRPYGDQVFHRGGARGHRPKLLQNSSTGKIKQIILTKERV